MGGIRLIGLFVCFGIVKYVAVFLFFFGFENCNSLFENGLIRVERKWKIIYLIVKFGLLIGEKIDF